MTVFRRNLAQVLREAQTWLAQPGNVFDWSTWDGPEEADRELSALILAVEDGENLPNRQALAVLFAPTGPIQEVSISSGWGNEFLALASRFDSAVAWAYNTQWVPKWFASVAAHRRAR